MMGAVVDRTACLFVRYLHRSSPAVMGFGVGSLHILVTQCNQEPERESGSEGHGGAERRPRNGMLAGLDGAARGRQLGASIAAPPVGLPHVAPLNPLGNPREPVSACLCLSQRVPRHRLVARSAQARGLLATGGGSLAIGSEAG